jgi:hypothetical protein
MPGTSVPGIFLSGALSMFASRKIISGVGSQDASGEIT